MFSNFIRATVATSFLAPCITISHADFLGQGGEIPATSPVYRTGDAPNTRVGLLNLLDTNGSQGFQYRGLAFLQSDSPSLTTTIYINDQDDSATYSYVASDGVQTAALSLSQLNDRGGDGFSFVTSYNPVDGDPSFNLFEKETDSTETFAYRLPISPNTSAAALDLIQSQGSQGWEWLGVRAIRESNGSIDTYQLFLNRSEQSGTFAYRGLSVAADPDAALAQLNAQGAAGYRYIVTLRNTTEGTSQNIYVRASANPMKYSYTTEAPPATRAAFVAQGNAQGAEGRYYKASQLAASNPSAFRSVYVRATAITPNAGGIDIARDGQISFTPIANGSFQLQTSPNLEGWTNSGAVQSGSAGVEIIFNNGAPAPTGRRFFRVVSP